MSIFGNGGISRNSNVNTQVCKYVNHFVVLAGTVINIDATLDYSLYVILPASASQRTHSLSDVCLAPAPLLCSTPPSYRLYSAVVGCFFFLIFNEVFGVAHGLTTHVAYSVIIVFWSKKSSTHIAFFQLSLLRCSRVIISLEPCVRELGGALLLYTAVVHLTGGSKCNIVPVTGGE